MCSMGCAVSRRRGPMAMKAVSEQKNHTSRASARVGLRNNRSRTRGEQRQLSARSDPICGFRRDTDDRAKQLATGWAIGFEIRGNLPFAVSPEGAQGLCPHPESAWLTVGDVPSIVGLRRAPRRRMSTGRQRFSTSGRCFEENAGASGV